MPSMSQMQVLAQNLLKDLIRPEQRVIYLDVPLHRNVGDMLIMLGTLKAMEHAGAGEIIPLCYSEDYCNDKWYNGNPVIVMQGGGNFGDLYPEHDDVRLKVLRKFRDVRTIFLPQTVHYQQRENNSVIKDAMKCHSDLHVFARDRRSLDYLRSEMDCAQAFLAPDMAHSLWPIRATSQPEHPVLQLIRRDGEGGSHSAAEHTRDWDDLYGRWERKLYQKPPRWAFAASRNVGIRRKIFQIWVSRAQVMVGRAVDLFSLHHRIDTSRLHGHILACLMEKPSVLFDNSYGKNHSYFETWTKHCGLPVLTRA